MRATPQAAINKMRRVWKAYRPPYPVQRDRRDMANLAVVLAAVLRPDSNCVDVGANRGSTLLPMVTLSPAGAHHAVEATPTLADDLRDRFPNVHVHNVAASDREGLAKFTIVDTDLGYSGLASSMRTLPDRWQHHDIEVRTARLDDLIPTDVHVAFVKIDVEGAELAVLRGATRILEQQPVVFLEHGAPRLHDSGEVHRLLSDHGYRVFDADGDGPYPVERFLEKIREDRMWNWLCVPMGSPTCP